MVIKDLSGKQICDIIKSCADSGVRELTLGSMSIKFGETKSIEGTQAPVVGTQPPPLHIAEAPVENITPEKQNESFMDAIQARTAEDVMTTQTLMDNPLQFEEDIVNGFMFDNKDGVNDTEGSAGAQSAL